MNVVQGGKQIIITPSGLMILIFYKDGLPHIEYFYPTNRQMNEIVYEEIMTPASVWNPTLLDDTIGASDLRIKQLPTTTTEFTDGFYNSQGGIIVHRTNIDNDFIISDNSSTSSRSRERGYRARSRKEKGKVCHSPKGIHVKWKDIEESPISLSAYPSTIQTDPVHSIDSRIRGVPRAVEAELQSLVRQARLHQKDDPCQLG